jgi:pimeloyl-ACP methyl ester carboxylesterase
MAMLSPHPKPLPAFAANAAIRRLQANSWVIRRSVQSMEAGKDLLDFQLERIKQPTLIVWGADDTLIPPTVGEAMHKAISGSSLLIVDGCGHLAPGECTQPVLRGTLEFFEAHPPLPRAEETVFGAPK